MWLSFQKDNEVVEVGGAYRNFNADSHKSSLRRPSIRLTKQSFAPRIGWTPVEAYFVPLEPCALSIRPNQTAVEKR